MNTRHITVFLVVGMAVALYLTHTHLSRSSLMSFAGNPALAQTPAPGTFMIKPVPNASGDSDDLWQHYEVRVPQTYPPLDMHIVFVADGHGIDVVKKGIRPWPQPITLKYRLMTDEHSNAILTAQGYRPRENIVPYFFDVDTGDGLQTEPSWTVRYKHKPGASRTIRPVDKTVTALVGEKVIFEDQLLFEEKPSYSFAEPAYTAYDPKIPSGAAHHLIVYIMFQPQTGPSNTVLGTDMRRL